VDHLGLEARVRFLGHREDIAEVLAALDVLLMPSWEEPFGRVAVEGMALGIPVVATKVGGPAEVIDDGYDGLLLPPKRPEMWASRVQELLADGDLRSRIGQRARRKASRFSVGRYTDAVLSCYEDALTDLPQQRWVERASF